MHWRTFLTAALSCGVAGTSSIGGLISSVFDLRGIRAGPDSRISARGSLRSLERGILTPSEWHESGPAFRTAVPRFGLYTFFSFQMLWQTAARWGARHRKQPASFAGCDPFPGSAYRTAADSFRGVPSHPGFSPGPISRRESSSKTRGPSPAGRSWPFPPRSPGSETPCCAQGCAWSGAPPYLSGRPLP